MVLTFYIWGQNLGSEKGKEKNFSGHIPGVGNMLSPARLDWLIALGSVSSRLDAGASLLGGTGPGVRA